MSKGPRKHDFLDICLTTFFRAINFENTSTMIIIFFGKSAKFNRDFKNANKKLRKTIFVFEIIASELVALNCLY